MRAIDKETRIPDSNTFRKALEKYLEALIELKGHAWCMDVRSERRKMAKLIGRVVVGIGI